jgi:hypothetical protein
MSESARATDNNDRPRRVYQRALREAVTTVDD